MHEINDNNNENQELANSKVNGDSEEMNEMIQNNFPEIMTHRFSRQHDD